MGLLEGLFKKKDELVANSGKLTLEEVENIQQSLQGKMDAATYNSLFNQACRLIPKKQYAEAIALFEAIKENTADTTEKGSCENQIGVCHFFMGDFKKALGYYTQSFHSGYDRDMVDYNIWEVCEELMKTEGDKSKWAQHYLHLFPEGKYAAKAKGNVAENPGPIETEEVNVMKNIALIALDKYMNSPRYELLETNIYKDRDEDNCVAALTYELEGNGDTQYPLEDILDQFSLYVSDFISEGDADNVKIVTVELAGEAEDLTTAMRSIVGKRVFNSEYTGGDGATYVKLVIE